MRLLHNLWLRWNRESHKEQHKVAHTLSSKNKIAFPKISLFLNWEFFLLIFEIPQAACSFNPCPKLHNLVLLISIKSFFHPSLLPTPLNPAAARTSTSSSSSSRVLEFRPYRLFIQTVYAAFSFNMNALNAVSVCPHALFCCHPNPRKHFISGCVSIPSVKGINFFNALVLIWMHMDIHIDIAMLGISWEHAILIFGCCYGFSNALNRDIVASRIEFYCTSNLTFKVLTMDSSYLFCVLLLLLSRL